MGVVAGFFPLHPQLVVLGGVLILRYYPDNKGVVADVYKAFIAEGQGFHGRGGRSQFDLAFLQREEQIVVRQLVFARVHRIMLLIGFVV